MNNLEMPHLAPFDLVLELAEAPSPRTSCLVFEAAFVNPVFEPDLSHARPAKDGERKKERNTRRTVI